MINVGSTSEFYNEDKALTMDVYLFEGIDIIKNINRIPEKLTDKYVDDNAEVLNNLPEKVKYRIGLVRKVWMLSPQKVLELKTCLSYFQLISYVPREKFFDLTLKLFPEKEAIKCIIHSILFNDEYSFEKTVDMIYKYRKQVTLSELLLYINHSEMNSFSYYMRDEIITTLYFDYFHSNFLELFEGFKPCNKAEIHLIINKLGYLDIINKEFISKYKNDINWDHIHYLSTIGGKRSGYVNSKFLNDFIEYIPNGTIIQIGYEFVSYFSRYGKLNKLFYDEYVKRGLINYVKDIELKANPNYGIMLYTNKYVFIDLLKDLDEDKLLNVYENLEEQSKRNYVQSGKIKRRYKEFKKIIRDILKEKAISHNS